MKYTALDLSLIEATLMVVVFERIVKLFFYLIQNI